MSSAYWDTLEAVRAVAAGRPLLVGLTVALRPALVHQPDDDTSRSCIVAPRDDIWEAVPEIEFDNGCMVDYPVMVALVVANAFDTDQFRWLVDAREDLRKALWKASLAGSPLVFDCDYDPRPKGGGLSGLGQAARSSVQQFTFRTKEARASS